MENNPYKPPEAEQAAGGSAWPGWRRLLSVALYTLAVFPTLVVLLAFVLLLYRAAIDGGWPDVPVGIRWEIGIYAMAAAGLVGAAAGVGRSAKTAGRKRR